MEISFVVEQLLNGFQLGVLLFLLAAGLTLVFGIMDLVNLAHGSIYMIGAFFAATMTLALDSFILGIIIALPMTLVLGMVLEFIALRTLYSRGHMDQVLATFGLILFLNELVRIIWGPAGLAIPLPLLLDGSISLPLGIVYPTYRMFIILIGIIVAIGLYYLVSKTRLGMLIRAGASNRTMVGALGINIRLLFTAVFGLGAMLAGLAGMLIAPINQAQIGMGEDILILAFVVIVIGGIGSIRGAFIAAIVAGVIDTMGRAFLDVLLLALLPANAAEAAGPALSSMLIYFLMAVVLIFRPQGLFPARNG
ncbi:MAG: High-affinity branched-chain amino acid transport system permease protein LivH [Alphaproteobacteria bacterium MarineAlpha12_Bin1]|jgi:branched-chain amino acid transport system permease protein|nr:MAG: High-affinity branched-chain amino acid transport system permease protein LivH [Alphaproteobacteria bacterium MarineAlpha12_Bin1]|tara:strand:- start:3287 stop:4210 length:924 start_codon:yes stop_codon:yes gene_type:complete